MKCPDEVAAGTAVVIVVAVTALTAAGLAFNRSLSFASVRSKFVPVKLTLVAATPLPGVKLVMVGTPLLAVTVKFEELVAEPLGEVTEMGPEVAEDGTATWSCVFVDDETVAVTPLNFTVFWVGVLLKPVPYTVTGVPTGPLAGVNCMIDTCVEVKREIVRIFPTAS
jgi:hypothetical protein